MAELVALLPGPALVALALGFGLLIGSFLNVVIHRLPLQLEQGWRRDSLDFLRSENPPDTAIPDTAGDAPPPTISLWSPPSHCPHCLAPVRPWHNIPVVSYVLLKGRCANCAQPISRQYPAVELACGVLTAAVVYLAGPAANGIEVLLVLAFTWALIALTGIDFNHQLLPDAITLPLLWLGLLANINGAFTALDSAVIGAVAGYLALWSVFWLFKLATGREGMGHGDFKLLAALGAWAGWQQLPTLVVIASLLGAVVGSLGVLLRGRDRRVPIAFGPYLAIAGWLVLVAQWQQMIKF